MKAVLHVISVVEVICFEFYIIGSVGIIEKEICPVQNPSLSEKYFGIFFGTTAVKI